MKRNTLFLAPICAAALFFGACTSGDKADNSSDSVQASDSMPDSMSTSMNPAEHLTSDTTTYGAAHADIEGTKPDTVVSGTAHFTKKGDRVSMTLALSVPKKAGSTVAVHFHDHGDCGKMGEGAHGHWNPVGKKHGKWGEGEFHSGDIGNIPVDKNGKASITVESDRWTIGGPVQTNILGRAIIVHAGVDDYKTQPTGASGSRIGCGVIGKM